MRFSLVVAGEGIASIKSSALECKLKERSPKTVASIVANEAGPPAFQAGAPMLQVRDLRTSILKPASFSLSAGEAIAVRGASGAGHTLLLCAGADVFHNEGLV